MIRFKSLPPRLEGKLDVAPPACVFFLLVMFLALSSHLAPTPGVRVVLPEAGLPVLTAVGDMLVVVLDREGRLFYDQQITTEERLERDLVRRAMGSSSGVELVLQADRDVRLEQLARLYALCLRAGVTNLKIQTRPERLLPVAGGGQP